MLYIIFSIVGVFSVLSGVFVLAALMLSSKYSADEPWEEYYPTPTKVEPIAIPAHPIEASS